MVVALVAAAGLLTLALLPGPWLSNLQRDRSSGHDELVPLLSRIDASIQRREVDGVAMDWRYQVSPSEEIRQTVICQLLAYVELYRAHPTARVLRDITDRADFLIRRLDAIRSDTPFDGMLGYSLLAAYDVARDERYFREGARITAALQAIPTGQCVLNGGLMAAMATTQYWQLTGDAACQRKSRDILEQLAPSQNEDGSFPHWCSGSRDIHYTGWMAMELIHIQRMERTPLVARMLKRMDVFLEGRIGADGRARYEEACPDSVDCRRYFYSRASGCKIDYDTRGWTVEPAYSLLVFDHFHSPRYAPVMKFLLSLEHDGTFADLYDYRPPPADPEYPWTIADTSMVNTSIIFWSLATALSGRGRRTGAQDPWFAVAEDSASRLPTHPGHHVGR